MVIDTALAAYATSGRQRRHRAPMGPARSNYDDDQSCTVTTTSPAPTDGDHRHSSPSPSRTTTSSTSPRRPTPTTTANTVAESSPTDRPSDDHRLGQRRRWHHQHGDLHGAPPSRALGTRSATTTRASSPSPTPRGLDREAGETCTDTTVDDRAPTAPRRTTTFTSPTSPTSTRSTSARPATSRRTANTVAENAADNGPPWASRPPTDADATDDTTYPWSSTPSSSGYVDIEDHRRHVRVDGSGQMSYENVQNVHVTATATTRADDSSTSTRRRSPSPFDGPRRDRRHHPDRLRRDGQHRGRGHRQRPDRRDHRLGTDADGTTNTAYTAHRGRRAPLDHRRHRDIRARHRRRRRHRRRPRGRRATSHGDRPSPRRRPPRRTRPSRSP